LSEIPSNVPRRTPAILVQGAAQDIVGVSRLLKAAGSDLQLESDIPYTEDGIFAVPERLGLATGVLYGPEVEFHLSPAMNQGAIRLFAPAIVERLNLLAAALDPNYQFLEALVAYITPIGDYFSKNVVEVSLITIPAERKGSTLGRHPKQLESMEARQKLYWESDAARLVMESLIERPTWNAIYAAFETIKTDLNVRKLVNAHLAIKKQEEAFNEAANNRTDRKSGARHGQTNANLKRVTPRKHLEMMSLLEARELHRQVICRYLDMKTKHRTAYEVVDNIGQRMGFGLDEFKHDLSK